MRLTVSDVERRMGHGLRMRDEAKEGNEESKRYQTFRDIRVEGGQHSGVKEIGLWFRSSTLQDFQTAGKRRGREEQSRKRTTESEVRGSDDGVESQSEETLRNFERKQGMN